MQRDEKVSESTELEIGQMKIWKSRKPTQQKGVSYWISVTASNWREKNQKPHPKGKADALEEIQTAQPTGQAHSSL